MNFDITTYKIKVPNFYDFKSNILILADIHEKNYDLIINEIENLNFDAIFIPGDLFIKHVYDINNSICKSRIRFLEYCIKKCPVYYSLGNHEWMFNKKDIDIIKKIGCIVIDNNFVKVSKKVYVGGLSSPLKYAKNGILPEYFEPNIKWIKNYQNMNGYKFLLCHHPEYYERYLKDLSIDLIIAGHAHGGQIRILNRGLYAPGQGLFPKYTSGYIDNKMVISRGLSNTIKFIPRINNSIEFVILNLIRLDTNVNNI